MKSAKELERSIWLYKAKYYQLRQKSRSIHGQCLSRDTEGLWEPAEYKYEIQKYQKTNNISSVIWSSVKWEDEILRFPIPSADLVFMPQDGKVLRRWKNRVVDKYLDFIARHGLIEALLVDDDIDDHPMWLCDYDDEDYDDEKYIYAVTSRRVCELAKNYDYGVLEGGKKVDVYPDPSFDCKEEMLYHQTKYSLRLKKVRDGSCSKTINTRISASKINGC